jgi:predicted Zn-dependent peptidase
MFAKIFWGKYSPLFNNVRVKNIFRFIYAYYGHFNEFEVQNIFLSFAIGKYGETYEIVYFITWMFRNSLNVDINKVQSPSQF